MASIELKQIVKEFDKGAPIIKNLDLTINDGEFLVIVGPSGCGKSTTLRLIAGLEEVT
ncbi:MAG TPA: ATP-binding cassette domain-containing protein, partial [Candidatus Marinimicrobia bacterium]|nr:ATP-binding cassette domain-containing protein [Candidatus Neomarinimicrobiota bacterium]